MADFVADLTPEPAAISALAERASAFMKDRGVDERAVHHVALVLDELLTNVAIHSGASGLASVRLTIVPERVSAEVLDDGAIFDPRLGRNAGISADLDGPVGGLGLALVHKLADTLEYGRVGDRNRTTFTICRMSAGQQQQGAQYETR
jgi:anti-sigma regulatory factor (Ser/Thr protein kinase)